MSYFTPDFIKFFEELSKNNNKNWFDLNRKTYEKEVKEPFKIFVAEMILRIQEYEPKIQIKPEDAIMRINKDIRFSKEKTPYNTHVSANISLYGKKDKSYPGIFFQFSHDKIALYGGAYMLDTSTLLKVRNYISKNLEEFSTTYNDKKFKEMFGTIQGEKHKRVPKEFVNTINKEPLLLNKRFYYTAELEPNFITTAQLPDQLMEYYAAGKKLNDFLKRAMK